MITTEHECYIRFILLLLQGGTGVLRDILNQALQQKNETLHQFLSAVKPAIKMSRKLTQVQKDTLYPLAPLCVSIEHFDITLLSFLIINHLLTYINHQEAQAVEDIRDLRNEFNAHAKEATMDRQTFTREWNRLVTNITTIGIGMSPELQQQHRDIIKSIEMDQLDVTSAVEEIKKLDQSRVFFENIQHTQERLVVAVDGVLISAQNTAVAVADVTRDLQYIKDEMVQIKAKLEQHNERKEAAETLVQVDSKEEDDTSRTRTTKYLQDGAEEINVASERKRLSGLHKYIEENRDEWKFILLNVAVAGVVGAGKSSFINTYLGLMAGDQRAAYVGYKECTPKAMGYSRQDFPNLWMWELPGVGSHSFPRYKYHKEIDVKRYDFCIIIFFNRITDNDVWVAKSFLRYGIRCYFIRTNIDNDYKVYRDGHVNSDSKQFEDLIKNDSKRRLLESGLPGQNVYVVENNSPNKYDFDCFFTTLLEDASDLKLKKNKKNNNNDVGSARCYLL